MTDATETPCLLAELSLDDVTRLSEAIRAFGSESTSMEEVAGRVVRHLYETLRDADGRQACALVRLYKTHPYRDLEPGLQRFAATVAGEPVAGDVRCFTLLATAGELPAWNLREASAGHKSIPLVDEQMVERLPMVRQLITELGLDLSAVVAPRADETLRMSQKTYGVFHVQEAKGSPHIPAQDEFVVPHRIASAVGFGGVLFTGDFYAVVLFSKVPLDDVVAKRLRILSLPLRVALLGFARGPVFAATT